MQQILTLLAEDADGPTISGAIENNGGSTHTFLAPTVLLVDGDDGVQNALNQTSGVLATLNDDVARGLVGTADMAQMDEAQVANTISSALGGAQLDDSTLLSIGGWIYGLSQAYATKKSDRPREGENWDMPGGCLPDEEL